MIQSEDVHAPADFPIRNARNINFGKSIVAITLRVMISRESYEVVPLAFTNN